MKKIISFLLAVLMLSSVMQIYVFAESKTVNYSDEKTGISLSVTGDFSDSASFKITDTSAMMTLLKSLGFVKDAVSYTATLSEGLKQIPVESATVTAPVPESFGGNTVSVYFIKKIGEFLEHISDGLGSGNAFISQLDYTRDGNNVTFTSKGLGTYLIVETPDPLVITYNLEVAGDSVAKQASIWDSYSNYPVLLGCTVNTRKIVKVEWSSDSKLVSVDNFGKVTNNSYFMAKANITATGYDRDGNVVATDTVKVKFYKFEFLLFLMK